MREVFNLQRTGVFWWGMLTATIFLIPSHWLKSFATFVRTSDLFRSDRPPFNWIDNAGTWIDAGTKAAIGKINFDPKAGLIYIGGFGLANLFVAILLGVILLLTVFIFYSRATRTHGIFDDLLAMALIYAVMRMAGVAAEGLQIPVIDFIQREEPRSYLLILSVYMLLLMFAGKAGVDSRVFFKVLFEAFLIWFMILPEITVQITAFIIEVPWWINYTLQSEPNIRNYYAMVLAVWALLGVALAGMSIYTAGRPPPPPAPEEPLPPLRKFIGGRR